MKIKSKQIAWYANHTIKKNPKITDVDSFLTNIKEGEWQDQIIKLRREKDLEKQKQLKKALPIVTVSGVFLERTAETIQTHSTYIAVDIDEQPQLSLSYNKLREKLNADPLAYAVFSSCRGNGFCVLVKIDPKAHVEAYAWMSKHFYKAYNINTDPVCKNLARVRYVSFDPDLQINNKALTCPATPAPKKERKALKKYHHTNEDFDRIIHEVKEQQIDLTTDYNDWLLCALSIQNKFEPETARNYFHEISEVYPDYDFDKTEQKFDSLLKDNRGEIPIDWFYAHVEKKGLKVYGKETEAKLVFQAFSTLTGDEQDKTAPDYIEPEILQQKLEEMPLVTKVKYYLKTKHDEYIRNEFTEELTAGGKPITDYELNSFYIECREKIDDKTQFDLIRRLLFSDFVRSVHPFKEFIKMMEDNLPPPHELGHNIDKIIKALSTDTQHAELFIKKWLVAMVASAFGNPSDLVLVFCGPQGTGKTEWFRRILPAALTQYRATLNWSGDRDEIIRMSRNLIMIDDEMGGKSIREEKQIKKIASIDKEQQRGAYKSMDEYFKRAAIFCGTTNDEWILSDPTGNRRFLPVFISYMDHALFNSVNKDYLFYELYLEWQNGFSTTLSDDDKKKLDEASRRFEKPHLEEELIFRYLGLPAEDRDTELLTATDIHRYLRVCAPGMNIKIEKLGAALKKAGFERKQKRVDGKMPWLYTIVKQNTDFNTEEDIL